ncbi:MAG: hypothetical protein K2X86_14745, partial [Cytophagaceae bacterium]|nr:hypothetical protein [Cytophagaceae bacterium]
QNVKSAFVLLKESIYLKLFISDDNSWILYILSNQMGNFQSSRFSKFLKNHQSSGWNADCGSRWSWLLITDCNLCINHMKSMLQAVKISTKALFTYIDMICKFDTYSAKFSGCIFSFTTLGLIGII